MGNGALPHGPSYRVHPRLYRMRHTISPDSAMCSLSCASSSPSSGRGGRLAARGKVPRGREDEERLTIARQYGRYGYRKIAGLLRQAVWIINAKRVERIWRREGLKVPHEQPKRSRLWLADGSCIRLRPEQRNHVGLHHQYVRI
jgi:hypothetical protein